ncbi:AbrB family transcriptional regulator [Klebsiella pneumoniae]|nr:AbrB family transcriptional regulator [Klebsiella pneumoniae]
MQATGIVRKIDNLGRFVLPIEIRRAQGITDGDLIEVYRNEDTVVLRKQKSTGIARKIDHLGRVVIPIELRRVLEIVEGDPVEVFVNKDEIVLRKYRVSNACAVTGEISYDNISLAGGKVILSPKALKNIAKEIKQLGLTV